MMDWMRNWEAIVTAGWVSQRDPLARANTQKGSTRPPSLATPHSATGGLEDRSAGAMRIREARAETRRSVGVVGRSAGNELNTHAQDRTAGGSGRWREQSQRARSRATQQTVLCMNSGEMYVVRVARRSPE